MHQVKLFGGLIFSLSPILQSGVCPLHGGEFDATLKNEIEIAAMWGRPLGGRLRVRTEPVRQFRQYAVQLRLGAPAFAGSYSDRDGKDQSSHRHFVLRRSETERNDAGL